jgi:hypothetical protein
MKNRVPQLRKTSDSRKITRSSTRASISEYGIIKLLFVKAWLSTKSVTKRITVAVDRKFLGKLEKKGVIQQLLIKKYQQLSDCKNSKGVKEWELNEP